MMEVHLMRPEWLWAIAPAVALILILWHQRGRDGSWHTVIAPELLQHLVGENAGGRSSNYLPIILIAWIFAAFAASGPSWQKIPQPIHQKQDALVLLLDLSYSMKSADLPPARVDRVRQKLLDLLQLRREGQTGLIAFAGDAHVVTPLTDDTPTIANLLPALHPDMMPVPGSNAADAVTQGLELLRSAGITQGRLLLVTDGVSEKDSKKIEREIKRSGAQLNVMGVGTTDGAPIPLSRGGFLKDEDGAIVIPGLKEKTLRELASVGSGRYMRIQINDADIDYLLAENPLSTREQTLALDRTADAWEDQGYFLILLLIPLVLALFRRGWLLYCLPLAFSWALLTTPQPAHAQSWDDLWQTKDQQGQRALQAGDNEAAAGLFENPAWAGTAAYRGTDYETAEQHFSSQETADSLYNKGNALARTGKLDDAIETYRESLALKPDQEDALKNIELLEQLKEQQEEQEEGESGEDSEGQEQQESEDGEPPEQQSDEESEGEPSQSDQQQQEGDSDQQSDPQQSEDEQNAEEQEEQEAETQPQEGKDGEPEEQQQAQASQANPEDLERDQAMEQWLRRVPDDPSGLLREKFRYESRQRQEQGTARDDEIYW
jgi:Ca-activated chloride channel family protein